MSKLGTAFRLLVRPKKMLQVVSEKYHYAIQLPYQEKRQRKRKEEDILKANKLNFGRAGMSDREFRSVYGRLEEKKYTALLFSLFIGSAGSLAATNYYSNWVVGLRKNNIDAIWVAQEMKDAPEVNIGFMEGPILIAPYKDPKFNVQRILENEKPKLILCHNNPVSMDFLEQNDTFHALKFVFVGDSMIPRIADSILRQRQIERIIGNADGLIVVSQYLKKSWIDYGFDESKIFITKTPVDEKAWPKYVGSGNQNRAAYFGNIYHKEIENILTIAPIVREAIPSFTVSIYGDGMPNDLEKLQKKIYSLGLFDCVKLEESVSLDEMRIVQSSVDALILPREDAEFSAAGFPNKVGEYLASGCPAVITATGEISEVISNREHAYLVEANDNKKFAHALIECLLNHENSKSIAQRGRAFISAYAAPEIVALDFLDWVERVYE